MGLRHPHYNDALNTNAVAANIAKPIDFVEIHAENFFAEGGISQALLHDVAEQYQVSVHGTSLGLGSGMPVPKRVLQKFAKVVAHSKAFLVSEHLCFNRVAYNEQVLHTGDLLPVPYNEHSLETICSHIHQVQDALKRPILIENLSAYLLPSELDEMAQDSMSEISFLVSMANRSGCGLLLDINNMIVNAINQNVSNVVEHVFNNVAQLPAHLIGEIHLAGFSHNTVNGFIVDDHANAVSEQCWELYAKIIALVGHKPTLIEWDNQLPEWHVLVGEATKAKNINRTMQTST
ncbi:MAG: DUF692 domain-containing protein [Glaciecola sp.]